MFSCKVWLLGVDSPCTGRHSPLVLTVGDEGGWLNKEIYARRLRGLRLETSACVSLGAT